MKKISKFQRFLLIISIIYSITTIIFLSMLSYDYFFNNEYHISYLVKSIITTTILGFGVLSIIYFIFLIIRKVNYDNIVFLLFLINILIILLLASFDPFSFLSNFFE